MKIQKFSIIKKKASLKDHIYHTLKFAKPNHCLPQIPAKKDWDQHSGKNKKTEFRNRLDSQADSYQIQKNLRNKRIRTTGGCLGTGTFQITHLWKANRVTNE